MRDNSFNRDKHLNIRIAWNVLKYVDEYIYIAIMFTNFYLRARKFARTSLWITLTANKSMPYSCNDNTGTDTCMNKA